MLTSKKMTLKPLLESAEGVHLTAHPFDLDHDYDGKELEVTEDFQQYEFIQERLI